MILKHDVFINVDATVYHLSVSAGKFVDCWIFTVDNAMHTAEAKKLLPHLMYFRFNLAKKYLSCFPPGAVADDMTAAIADALKKQEMGWTKGLTDY